jgi:thiamine-phosphate pyrophosphorylase
MVPLGRISPARLDGMSPDGDERRARLQRAQLYLVCDRRSEDFLQGALRGGVDMIQLRDKHASDEEVLQAAPAFRRACDEHDALFLVNDRPELAVAAGADGVHVGQDDVPLTDARGLVGPDRLVGLSTHSPAQVEAGAEADYLAVGPVHATPTKPGRPAVGLGPVRHAAKHADGPWFAIGGITPENVGEAVAAGATRIVVVRAITDADDPEAAARALRRALPEGSRVGAP